MVEYGEVCGDIRQAVNPDISRCLEIGRSGHQDIRVQDTEEPRRKNPFHRVPASPCLRIMIYKGRIIWQRKR